MLSSPNHILTLQNIAAQMRGLPLYSDLSISILSGCVIAIFAPNGTGKTTLLKQISGLHHVEEGCILWNSRPITHMKHYENALLWLGDAHGLIPSLSTISQLQYIAKLWGEVARLPATIHYLGLAPYLQTPISELSSGWKRRVALARLMLIPADIWVLDEPFNHLDDAGIYLLTGLINSHADKGGICIFSTTNDNPPKLPNHQVQLLDLRDFISA